jgi:hypothetical protein
VQQLPDTPVSKQFKREDTQASSTRHAIHSNSSGVILSTPLIISIKESRKLLGSWSKELPDAEVERIITLLTVIAKETVNPGSKY